MADNFGGLLDFEQEESDDQIDNTIDDSDVADPSQEADQSDDRSDEDRLAEALDEEDYEEEDPNSEGDESGDDADSDAESEEEQAFKNEENARNAERRRQNEQRLMERLKSQMPEYQFAKQLSDMYGKPVEQLMAELQEANIARMAQQQGIPVEVQRQITLQEQRLQQLEQQNQMNEFMQWNTRIDSEMSALKNEYPMLDESDLVQAKDYLLGTLQNTDIPLKQAVLAIHADKIINGLQEAARNETLAQVSGRKKSSVIPPKGKASTANKGELSADEALVAKEIFGMSEEDYLKYK
ncbi:hypothetical protein D1872_90080 [compost metagenome]